jgi:hypothetical protein
MAYPFEFTLLKLPFLEEKAKKYSHREKATDPFHKFVLLAG